MSDSEVPTIDDAATELVRSSMPFCASIGVSAATSTPDLVTLMLPWDASLCTIGGVIHGGVLMALADSSGAMCAFLNLPDDAAGTSTIESKTNFLGAATDGTVVATSVPLHAGGSTIVVETELRVGDRLVAKTTQTQIVRRSR